MRIRILGNTGLLNNGSLRETDTVKISVWNVSGGTRKFSFDKLVPQKKACSVFDEICGGLSENGSYEIKISAQTA